MPADSRVEETKQTLVQRFRAWGGTSATFEPLLPISTLWVNPNRIAKALTLFPSRKFIPAYRARLAHRRATCASIPVLPDALPASPTVH